MKIITVNLPQTYLKAMNNYIGEKHQYPSRSELIRVAVREFLIKELESSQSFSTIEDVQKKLYDDVQRKIKADQGFVQVPIKNEITINNMNKPNIPEPNAEYKTYRIIKKEGRNERFEPIKMELPLSNPHY